jgi:hypothetical protein
MLNLKYRDVFIIPNSNIVFYGLRHTLFLPA